MRIYRIAYFIDGAKGFILHGDDILEVPTDHTHSDLIMDHFGLYDKIQSAYRSEFGEALDWDDDEDYVSDFVHLFMDENDIFAIVLDIANKQVYVRPNLGGRPSSHQVKVVSDWAIEHGWQENVIIDVVTV